jgi:4-azaleucine resistance transporter AzlC
MKPYPTPQTAFKGAIRAFIPVTLGIIPFGVVFGVSAAEIGINAVEGIGMSMIMFAGAAQLVTVELLKNDAAVWVIVLSALVVNVRFVIYSASLTLHFKSIPFAQKLLAAYFITDQPYAMSIAYFNEYPDAPHKFWYYLGHAIGLWVTWVISSAVGLIVGAVIPESWSLGFVIPLMFIGLVTPAIRGRSYLVSAVVSGTTVVALHSMPNNLGLMVAIALGILSGVMMERFE